MRFPHILLTTALIACSGAAVAQPWHGDHHGGNELFRGVTLTDAQKAQIKTIEQAGWAQAKPVMEQMRAIHEQIEARMLAAGDVSEADMAPLVTQEENLRNQLDQQRLARGLQIRQVMTPTQLAEAATKHQQLESLHEQERQVAEPVSAQ